MTRTDNAGATEISRWFGCEYRVYTEDRSLYERLIRRKGCCHSARYYYPDGTRAWDVIVSEDQVDSIRKQIGTRSQPPETAAKRGLNDKDLHDPKSPQGANDRK